MSLGRSLLMAFLSTVVVVALLHLAFVALGARLLMRPGLAVWRETLRERRWRWLRWVFTFSPTLFSFVEPWLHQMVATSFPATMTLWMWWGMLMMVTTFMIHALAACWWCLPPDDRSSFPIRRAFGLACGILVLNLFLPFVLALLRISVERRLLAP